MTTYWIYWLKRGLIPLVSKYSYGDRLPEEFVAVVRASISNTFGQSSAYDEFPEYYPIFDEANKKHQYNFRAY